MFCTNCGKQIADGNSFCTSCGKPVNGSAAAASETTEIPPSYATPVVPAPSAPASPVASQESAVAAKPSKKSSGKTIGIIIVIAAVVIIGAAIAAFVLITNEESQESSVETPVVSSAQEAAVEPEGSSSSSSSSSSAATSSSQASNATTNDYVLADSATHLYTEAELASLSDWELFLARNEIFARHGRGFKNDMLITYFSAQPWYKEQYSPDVFDSMPSPLNETEKKNAELIRSIEDSRGSVYTK